MQGSIKETSSVEISYDDDGRKRINEYVMHEVIGKGSYSKVKLSYNIEDKKYYAIKIINRILLAKKKKGMIKTSEGNMSFVYMLEDALNEINILKILNTDTLHKNVIKLHEIINYENESESISKIYLVLEYCKRGSIMNYNDRTGVFTINNYYKCIDPNKEFYSEDEIKNFVRDMAEGLEFSKYKIFLFS
jgi:serine/threonine protein kinase